MPPQRVAALRVAAEVYEGDAERIVSLRQQFSQQAQDARRIADELEDAE